MRPDSAVEEAIFDDQNADMLDPSKGNLPYQPRRVAPVPAVALLSRSGAIGRDTTIASKSRIVLA
jgi:hypothetical protein